MSNSNTIGIGASDRLSGGRSRSVVVTYEWVRNDDDSVFVSQDCPSLPAAVQAVRVTRLAVYTFSTSFGEC